ncbi:hypothetical protein GIB67_017763 [Kingdonia uniflora]|uniref:Uncharacterized protein n=1 Tax=Kingdonia uniflora TaxID=39325 RepID=A0A7J7LQF9_9MAGN|nr:hypothetical protein GIB67_017763 [Kingdonia uniflora]
MKTEDPHVKVYFNFFEASQTVVDLARKIDEMDAKINNGQKEFAEIKKHAAKFKSQNDALMAKSRNTDIARYHIHTLERLEEGLNHFVASLKDELIMKMNNQEQIRTDLVNTRNKLKRLKKKMVEKDSELKRAQDDLSSSEVIFEQLSTAVPAKDIEFWMHQGWERSKKNKSDTKVSLVQGDVVSLAAGITNLEGDTAQTQGYVADLRPINQAESDKADKKAEMNIAFTARVDNELERHKEWYKRLEDRLHRTRANFSKAVIPHAPHSDLLRVVITNFVDEFPSMRLFSVLKDFSKDEIVDLEDTIVMFELEYLMIGGSDCFHVVNPAMAHNPEITRFGAYYMENDVDSGWSCGNRRDRLKQTKEKPVSLLKIHRKPNLKKKDDLEMGDSNDQLMTLEITVFNLTSTVGELVEQLRLTKLVKASTSVKRRGHSKKKGVMEVDEDGDIAEIDSDFSNAESTQSPSVVLFGICLLFFKLRNQIEVPIICVTPEISVPIVGSPAVVVPTVGAPVIGSSCFTTEIRAAVVRWEIILYYMEILHSLGSTSSLLLRKLQNASENEQVAPEEGLKVVKDLMVDDDVEVGREVNFKAISSEYGGDLLEWKKGDNKDNDDKKDVEDKSMVVAEVAKNNLVFFNQEEIVGDVYQVSTDQTTAVSVEEQTLESKESKEEVEQNKEEVAEGNDDDDGNS